MNDYEYLDKHEKVRKNISGTEIQPSLLIITEEMHMRTRELAIDPNYRTKGPADIWPVLKNEMDVKYPETNTRGWSGMRRKQVMRHVWQTRTELGMGDTISTFENNLEYLQMNNAEWSFLRFSATLPVPGDEKDHMHYMIFCNPELIRLLKMPQVDLFIDATFDCCPHPFYQCLIIMVYDPTTSYYVPVLYCLMTRKNEHLYYEVFHRIVCEADWQLEVKTFTTDFEIALMKQAEKQFGEFKHIGCFFHLKQAWRRYLTVTLRMEHVAIKVAMEVGALDLLCIIPRDEIIKYGIPYVRAKVECGQSEETVQKWDEFWKYFRKQWLSKAVPVSSWNICKNTGNSKYIQMVNRTNNALER